MPLIMTGFSALAWQFLLFCISYCFSSLLIEDAIMCNIQWRTNIYLDHNFMLTPHRKYHRNVRQLWFVKANVLNTRSFCTSTALILYWKRNALYGCDCVSSFVFHQCFGLHRVFPRSGLGYWISIGFQLREMNLGQLIYLLNALKPYTNVS